MYLTAKILTNRAIWYKCQIPKKKKSTFEGVKIAFMDAAIITTTRLYSFDPLKSHFYSVKLGFTGVYITFLISTQKHWLWVLVRTTSFCAEIWNYQNSSEVSIFFILFYFFIFFIYLIFFFFFFGKILNVFEYACFRNDFEY